MTEYSSIRTSSWDVDAMVTQLNERASHGWTVVSIVNTGGELAAILQRPSSRSDPSSGSGGVTTTVAAVAAGSTQVVPVVAPVAAVPVNDDDGAGWAARAQSAAESVVEPAGWGARAESVVESAVEPAMEVAVEPVSPVAIGVTEPSVIEPAIQATPVSVTPAGWYPDPSGRFEMRYWDGTAWTEHVARGGQQYTDPPIA
jgi:hypothetical protein